MIDHLFDRLAVKIALVFVVLELTYVNSKSLLFLVHSYRMVDCFFSIVGAAAFSLVTVIVMQKSESKRLKIAFPLFDIALMFCGLNIEYADAIITGNDNPFRFALTIIISLFTGLITYSLGFINRNELNRSVNVVDSVLQSEKSNGCTADTISHDPAVTDLLHDAIRYKAWRARKKNESIRTDLDTVVCLLSDRIKQGETITINDYLLLSNGTKF